MQIVSDAFAAPKVHFEAPSSARVLDAMARFIDWFNETARSPRRHFPSGSAIRR